MDNPIVVPDDIENRWRPLTDQEKLNADALTGDAWRMIRSRIGDETLDEKSTDVTNGEYFIDDVVMVIANAVIRVLKNPDGKRQESIDDYAWTRDRVLSAGVLYITDDEWRVLGVSGAGRGAAFQIDTTPSDNVTETWDPIEVTGIPEWLDWT